MEAHIAAAVTSLIFGIAYHTHSQLLSRTDVTALAEPARITFRVEREQGSLEWAI